jgi:hypothetical protein
MEPFNKRLNDMLNPRSTSVKAKYIDSDAESSELEDPKISQELIDIMLEAIKLKHKFTQKQINGFIIATLEYSFENQANWLLTDNTDCKHIVKYIFTNYDIPQNKVRIICDLNKKDLLCIGYLFEKNYNFTDDCLKALLKTGFAFTGIDCYTKSHPNVIYIAYTSEKDENIFNKCIDLILKDTVFNSRYVELIYMFVRKNNINYKNLCILLNAVCKHSNSDDICQIIEDGRIFLDYKNSNIFDYIIDKYKFPEKLIKFVLKNDDNDECFLTMIQKGYNPTVDDINLRLLKGDKLYISNSKKYKFLTVENKKVTDVLSLFEIFGLEPNLDTLNISCKKGYIHCVNKLIKDYGIIPLKETLDESISSLNTDIITTILNFKILPDDITFYMINYNKCVCRYTGCCLHCNSEYDGDLVSDVVELLILHGLVIKFEHIEYLVSFNYGLKNLDRFNIAFDDKLFFVCFVNDNFPWDEIAERFSKLHRLCLSKKLKYETLIEYMKNNNIKLNRYDLHYLLKFNKEVGRKIMNNYMLIPSLITIFRANGASTNDIKNVVKKYEITEHTMLEEYDINL